MFEAGSNMIAKGLKICKSSVNNRDEIIGLTGFATSVCWIREHRDKLLLK
jgi:hypothetical protein